MTDVQKLSQAAFDRLQAEFDDLTGRGRVEVARKIEAARELGDLKENGDYHAAKDEQGQMEARIRTLQATLENSEIVENSGQTDKADTGNIVGLKFAGGDDVTKFLIGSIEEGGEFTVISPGSPLGSAIIGAKVGETVSYEAPGGQLSAEVVSIEA